MQQKKLNILDAEYVVVGNWFSFQSHSDKVTDCLDVFIAVGVTVKTDCHQQLLCWPCQLK